MTDQTETSTQEEEPRKKVDWAAVRAQNEVEFQGAQNRVAAAYNLQRENLAQEARAGMMGITAMQQITRQLIAHGDAERQSQREAARLAGPIKFARPLSEIFHAVAYEVPAAKTAIHDFAAANSSAFRGLNIPDIKPRGYGDFAV